MVPFDPLDEQEIERLNRLQRDLFDRLYPLFDPPLPEGVPERLDRIVASAKIARGEKVLDVGSGTGILIPRIRRYRPAKIYACDLSEAMLKQLHKHHREVKTFLSDIRDLGLPDQEIDVVFINACYPNIVDKDGALKNISRMTKPAGRLVISHPLGRRFIASLKKTVPFPLDDFPQESEAPFLFAPYGFLVKMLIDEPLLYLLLAERNI